MSSTYKQYLRTKSEVESSMVDAKSLRDQWLAATRENPTNLTKKEVDYIGKAFKNRLLTVKWDCEDLEELIGVGESSPGTNFSRDELVAAKCFIEDCRAEISKLMDQLEEAETNSKIFNKHGIMLPTIQTQATTLTSVPSSKYDHLLGNEGEEVQFDKGQIESSSSVFNNALYDHLEQKEEEQRQLKSFNTSQVFNNLSRPVTNVYMNPNENEIILDMLETEYYNPPSDLQGGSRLDNTIRKILETDRNKFLGTVALLFSFPILFVLFLAM